MTRSIDLSVEVPGSPQEVWEAVASGPGISSWFVAADVAADEGLVTLDFGPYGKDVAKILEWEPPRRFVAGSGEMACEWLVETRQGGTCVVRLVNSGFGEGAEFDEQYDGTATGWVIHLEKLRLHLTRFRGRVARPAIFLGTIAGPPAAAWKAVRGALGIDGDLREEDRFATAAAAPPLTGTVTKVVHREGDVGYVALLDGDNEGTMYAGIGGTGDNVSVRLFLYLYGDDGTVGDAWMTLMRNAFG